MFKFIQILALAASTAQALKVRESDDKVCTSEFCGDISEKDITTLYVDDTNVCPFTGKNLGQDETCQQAPPNLQARYPTDPYDNSHYIDYNALFPDYHPEDSEKYENPWDYKDHKEEEEAEEEQENRGS